MLALVLTLSIAGPGTGLAADLAFHAGSHHGRSEGPAVESASARTVVDPGVTEHLHCGCHQAAPLETGSVAPPAAPGRPIAARIAPARASVVGDRLPRPPRA
ncbi:hypothetical protein [Methylobacterium sp. NEAU K]|uniref:hypothetical protein n=1 Tax=Methylobacterium sp. NEAU K TaxID=3064946 RepID=UPI0027366A5C|nr:hypothetical protein [Methylobacterium sp. NEAU K]MDP4006912.1 hypothetical protein [Methylobacterium sp. NEAU K]